MPGRGDSAGLSTAAITDVYWGMDAIRDLGARPGLPQDTIRELGPRFEARVLTLYQLLRP